MIQRGTRGRGRYGRGGPVSAGEGKVRRSMLAGGRFRLEMLVVCSYAERFVETRLQIMDTELWLTLLIMVQSSNTGIDVYTPSIRKESTNRCFQTLNRTTNEQANSDFSTTEQNSATVTHNSGPQESNESKKHEENVKNATEGASSHSDSKADTKTDKKSYAAETMKSLSKKKSFSRQKSSWAEEMEEEEAEDGRGKGA